MNDEQLVRVDTSRRRWLVATTTASGIGMVAATVPFLESLAPSEKTKGLGAPVDVDIAGLKPGESLTAAWRGKPVFVVNRTDGMLATVVSSDSQVADPATRHPLSMPLPSYCRNEYRSRAERKNILVLIGVCTHLGCTPTARFQPGPQANLPNDWPGGFLCPCHGSTYDLAGRVFKNKPAPQNLDVPKFMFPSSIHLVIGRDESGDA
ncbi:ubiquinol-cytochrome c reductase iron-sulfur subunit [Burkholderia vietnamiensis]|uniref:ubiquinol-cytochrome c reductase iron-sulfur subunit n=1 Tax=Burkholderia vietnamiensis TaxID=60552 RepID=UPI001CF1FE12|nr:ubiquinol-cytochrome c reductase iron-sulfur subunit [Burkholderia vietnamiensis]MCA7988591.1 ubiquinol-cytochrome c reductase iron-sulfur subunit [Burkholderia vietnamiensis]